eukprot:COSAG06_NODE_3089_length_5870_cov_178.693733_4_plen_107_part_00
MLGAAASVAGTDTTRVAAACEGVTAESHAVCSLACAAVFLPWWTVCSAGLTGEIRGTFSDFVETCTEAEAAAAAAWCAEGESGFMGGPICNASPLCLCDGSPGGGH